MTKTFDYTLFDHLPLGICVLQHDYVVLFWNACLEDWTQIPRTEIVGSEVGAFFSRLREAQYRSRLDTVFAGGPPAIFSSQLHKYFFTAPMPDGTVRFQNATVTAIPCEDSTHNALVSVEDVTELTRRMHQYRAMRDQIRDEMRKREEAAAELKTLTGLLPICSICKNIRDDKGYWRQIELYIRTHSSAEFSHGICPECARKAYPELNLEEGAPFQDPSQP